MRWLRIFLFEAAAPALGLAAFLLFNLATSAQIVVREDQWPGTSAYYARVIQSGTSELKRDVLHDIRGHRTPEASALALPALKDTDPVVRATAASAVIWLDPEAATGALVPLLDDRSEFVRREAAYALARAGTSAAVPSLSLVLRRDRDLEVSAAAAAALGSIGDPAAVEPLIEALRARRNEETEFLRSIAARSIGQIALFVRSGTKTETVPQNFLSSDYKLKMMSIAAAGPAPTFQTAAAGLRKVLSDDREAIDIRRNAVFAIGAIGEAGMKPLLERFTSHPDPYLAEIAREALLMLSQSSDEN